MAGAAFFDLDRTLLRRSSSVALARPFRRRGLISRTALLRAALWQALFVVRGASGEAVRWAAEEGRKVDAVRELAGREGLDLSSCTAYSDGHTDLPFLEAVGKPVAVNPDRRLRRIAEERGWPILRFREAHAA